MPGWLQQLDETVLLWIHQGWRTPVGDWFFPWITELNHLIIPLVLLWLGLVVWGGRRGRVLAVAVVLGLVLTDQLSSQVLKPLVARTRPCFEVPGVDALVDQVNSRSFPSGHAANTFGAATLFALILGGWWRLAYVPAILVSLSRVYIGVHYPLDVLAGAVLGLGVGFLIWSPLEAAGVLHPRVKEPADRRRSRSRRRPPGDAASRLRLLLLPVVPLLATCMGCGGEHREEPDGSLAAGSDSAATVAERYDWTAHVDTVRRGDTFSRLLLRNRLYLSDIERVVNEVRQTNLFPLRRLHPGETVAVTLDGEGRLRHLEYTKSPDRVYVVEGDPDTLTSFRTGLAYDTYLRKFGGTVSTTVDEALRVGGAGAGIVMELAEIFASDIDFLTEPRVGDRVAVLVEEKRFRGEPVGLGSVRFASYEGKKATQTAIRVGGEDEEASSAAAGYYTPAGESLVRTFLRSPLNFKRISSRFSHRRFHPVLRVWRPHLGIDYAAPTGTPVVAVANGVISYVGWNGGFGRQVRVRHDSIYESCYGHLSRYAKGITKGARVEKNQVIGFVGSTGLATGPHLDYRMRKGGEYIDPLRMKNPPTAPIPEELRGRFDATAARLAQVCDSLQVGEAVLWVRAVDGGGMSTPLRDMARSGP